MTRLLLLALSILLLPVGSGCEGYYDTEGEVVDACPGQHIDRLRPRADADDAYVDGHVFVTLACPVTHGVITLRTVQGEAATGLVTLHHGGHQVRFRPSPRLRTRTAYDVLLDTSAGFHEWRFVTSALGDPAGDQLAGVALALRPWTGTLMEPPGLEDVLEPSLERFHPVIQFMSNPAGSSVMARLGGSLMEEAGDPQDFDQPVLDLSSSWDDPFWRFGPFDLEWELNGFLFVVRDAVFSGALAADLDGGGGVALTGTWDVRTAQSALGDVCGLTAQAGGDPCAPCDDGVEACLSLSLVQALADPWFGVLEAP